MKTGTNWASRRVVIGKIMRLEVKKAYCNFGTGYVAALVELVSGQSFSSFCQQNVFAPLGMDGPDEIFQEEPRRLCQQNSTSQALATLGTTASSNYASGSLQSSANDFSRFLGAMLLYGENSLWTRATGLETVTCQKQDGNGNAVNNSELE